MEGSWLWTAKQVKTACFYREFVPNPVGGADFPKLP